MGARRPSAGEGDDGDGAPNKERGPGEDLEDLQAELARQRDTVARLEAAQSVAHVGSWEWDPVADQGTWSDEMCRLFGLEPGDNPTSYDAYFEFVHPDDKEGLEAAVEQALAREDHFGADHRILRPDGDVRWVHAAGQITRKGGKPVRMTGTVQDITERRAAERKFELLLESAPDAMVIADHGGRIVLANQQASTLFGYGPEELVGRPIEDLVPERFAAAHMEHREGYMKAPEARPMGTGLDLRAVRKDGTEFPVEISLSPIRTEEGLLVTAAIRDITERQEAEEADRTARRRLEEIDQLRKQDEFKTNLLNTAAHELNTPMTPIRLQLHLLQSGALGEVPERQQRAVEILDRNAERLSAIITDFLDVARLESGRMAMEPQPLGLAKASRDVVESFREPAQRVGVKLEVDIPEDLGVNADPHRLGQVLYNLVSNAIKFTPEGGRVSLRAAQEGDRVAIEVQDTGIGMDPSQIDGLFQPFSQVHDKDRVKASGTGLGLYISKGIVEAHGGALEVESPGPGKGSTFRFDLERAESSDEAPGTEGRPSLRQKDDIRRTEGREELARRLRELI